jgi:hypothetical protein
MFQPSPPSALAFLSHTYIYMAAKCNAQSTSTADICSQRKITHIEISQTSHNNHATIIKTTYIKT